MEEGSEARPQEVQGEGEQGAAAPSTGAEQAEGASAATAGGDANALTEGEKEKEGEKAEGEKANGAAAATEGEAAKADGAKDGAGESATKEGGKAHKSLTQMYKVACLNCSVQLHIELPPNCSSFQCCQCHAIHKIILPDPALEENRKRKRKDKKERKEGTEGPPRELSVYNKYMKAALAEIKAQNPGLEHKEAFKLAIANWATAPENPKFKEGGGSAATGGEGGAAEGGEGGSKEGEGGDKDVEMGEAQGGKEGGKEADAAAAGESQGAAAE